MNKTKTIAKDEVPMLLPTKKQIPLFKAVIPRKKSASVLKMIKVAYGYAVAAGFDSSVYLKTNLSEGLYQIVGHNLEPTKDNPDIFPTVFDAGALFSKSKIRFDLTAYMGTLYTAMEFASSDVHRPVLNSVLLSYDHGYLEITATDGRRLYERTVQAPLGKKSFTFIVPAKLLSIAKRFGSGCVQVGVYSPNTAKDSYQPKIILNICGNYIVADAIDRDYPNPDKVYAFVPRVTFTIDKKTLSNALAEMIPYANPDTMAVKISQTDTGIRLRVYSSEIDIEKVVYIDASAKPQTKEEYWRQYGNQALLMPLRGDADESCIVLNIKYLKQIIDFAYSDTVEINLDIEDPPIVNRAPALITLNRETKGRVSERKIEMALNDYTAQMELGRPEDMIQVSKQRLDDLLAIAKYHPTGEPK